MQTLWRFKTIFYEREDYWRNYFITIIDKLKVYNIHSYRGRLATLSIRVIKEDGVQLSKAPSDIAAGAVTHAVIYGRNAHESWFIDLNLKVVSVQDSTQVFFKCNKFPQINHPTNFSENV